MTGDQPAQQDTTGTLFVVPTPLGNLEDITLRGLRVLRQADVIAAEDTRRARALLTSFGISTPTTSYHQHGKVSGIPKVLKHLRAGRTVALISDAGTPSIADPGFELVQAALAADVRVEALPGPSAVTTAVVLASMPAKGFTFLGFLPREQKEMSLALREVSHNPYAIVFFESPHRVASTIEVALGVLGNRMAVGLHEMTKVHEQAVRGDLKTLLETVSDCPPRGEWTIVIGPAVEESPEIDMPQVEALLRLVVEKGVSGRDAVQISSEFLGLPRQEVYRIWLKMVEKTDIRRRE